MYKPNYNRAWNYMTPTPVYLRSNCGKLPFLRPVIGYVKRNEIVPYTLYDWYNYSPLVGYFVGTKFSAN